MTHGSQIPTTVSRYIGTVLLLLCAARVTARDPAERMGVTQPAAPREVRFESGNVMLAGLLRVPGSPGPCPAVVLLGGSLPTAKEDERLATVAAAFVARGFAVLTTDSRGTGASQGEFDTTSLEQLAGDAAAAAAMLRQRADVRVDAVGFWGVSQGATWVGPLAAERGDAAFLVAVSGPLVSPEVHVHRFLAGRLRSDHGLDDATVERVTKARHVLWDYYATGQGYEMANAAVDALRKEPWFGSSGLPPTVTVPSQLAGLPERTRTFLAQKDFDPLAAIGRLRCPLLAVYGAQDTQLPVDEYAETLRTLGLRAIAGINVEVLQGLDHDLRPALGGPTDPNTGDPFEVMARWALAQVTGQEARGAT